MNSNTVPPDVIAKYRKVKAYAERGEGNERQNARRIMESLEAKYPGLGRAAAAREAFERPGSFVVPEGPPPPGFWEACFDAAGLFMGRSRPEDLLYKYMEAFENASSEVPPGTELVELTDQEAKRLVIATFQTQVSKTPFGALRLKVETPANTASILKAYSYSEHNRRLIARHFGAMMNEFMLLI